MRPAELHWRYFRADSGPLIETLAAYEKVNRAARDEYAKILHEVGAETDTYLSVDSQLVGMFFDDAPGAKYYKRVERGAWYPKQNTDFGRALHKRIKAVPTCKNESALNRPNTIMTHNRIGRATVTHLSRTGVAFVCLPWFDCDPAVLAGYDLTTGGDSNLDAIATPIPDEWVEVKRWEVDREIEEYNA